MDDAEIIRRLQEADALLARYTEVVKPAAEALAERKSLHVYKEPGHYTGDLGCWESGINEICLHTKEIPKFEESEKHYDLIFDFEDEWRKKAPLKNIYIGGHY